MCKSILRLCVHKTLVTSVEEYTQVVCTQDVGNCVEEYTQVVCTQDFGN